MLNKSIIIGLEDHRRSAGVRCSPDIIQFTRTRPEVAILIPCVIWFQNTFNWKIFDERSPPPQIPIVPQVYRPRSDGMVTWEPEPRRLGCSACMQSAIGQKGKPFIDNRFEQHNWRSAQFSWWVSNFVLCSGKMCGAHSKWNLMEHQFVSFIILFIIYWQNRFRHTLKKNIFNNKNGGEIQSFPIVFRIAKTWIICFSSNSPVSSTVLGQALL